MQALQAHESEHGIRGRRHVAMLRWEWQFLVSEDISLLLRGLKSASSDPPRSPQRSRVMFKGKRVSLEG